MILLTVVGGGLGLLSAIAILIEQMLCPIGYDNVNFCCCMKNIFVNLKMQLFEISKKIFRN